MKRRYSILVLLTALFGYGCSSTPPPAAVPVGSVMRQAYLLAPDPPELKQTYTVVLPSGHKVEMDIRNSPYRSMPGRRVYGYTNLRQSDGKLILFDPERIAERTLQQELVPGVEAAVAAIRAADEAFMASSDARQFTDSTGVTWRRVDKE